MNAYEYQRRHLAQQAVRLADKIERDFVATDGGVATYLLAQARKEAGDALMALADTEPTDVEEIRRLQNIVHRHRDLTEWLAAAAEAGRDEWHTMTDGERDAVAQTVNPQEIDD